MSKTIIMLVILSVMAVLSCKQEKKADPSAQATPAATQPSTAPNPAQATGPEVPGVPEEVMIKLLNECTFVDYIFHDLPFSLSQNEDPSIDQNILYMDIKRPVGKLPTNCKATARKFFQIKGEIVYDVDVYLGQGCNYYVFVDKKNKPIYANYLTPDGVKFYYNIINQAVGSMQKK